jgi:hypothetical protein
MGHQIRATNTRVVSRFRARNRCRRSEALQSQHPPPLELLPWLTMAVLIVLTIESLLANRFYRRAVATAETSAVTSERGA